MGSGYSRYLRLCYSGSLVIWGEIIVAFVNWSTFINEISGVIYIIAVILNFLSQAESIMNDDNSSFEHVSTVMQPSTPVKWTPEDAANFIASTIKEAQKPTIMAIRKRGVSWWVYLLTVIILLGALAGVVYYFMWLRDSEWNGRELMWREREAKLSKDLLELSGKYDQIVNRKLDMAVEIASDAVDNTTDEQDARGCAERDRRG